MFFALLLLAAANCDSSVDGFKYNLSMASSPALKRPAYIRTRTFIIKFTAETPKLVAASEPSKYVRVETAESPNGVDVLATDQRDVQTDRFVFLGERAENSFTFQLMSLMLAPNGDLPLEVRFKDATDKYVLRHENQKLTLEATDSKFGTVVPNSTIDFTILETTEGDTIYRCNPFTISAHVSDKLKWRTNLQMNGPPASIHVVGKTLFIETVGGYSMYLLTDSGQLLIYHGGVLDGEDPVAETIAAGHEGMKLPPGSGPERILIRYYNVGVELSDRRVIPFLIDSIEQGMGLQDRAWAIAGLEKFNGIENGWQSLYAKHRRDILRDYGISRVFPDSTTKVESDRWRKVFADELK